MIILAQSTVKYRLDTLYSEVGSLDGMMQEVAYQRMTISGLDCHVSSGGIKICTLDLDINDCVWTDSTAFSGSKILTNGVSENLPNAVYTLPPTISLAAYKTNSGYSFMGVTKLPPSNTYIGNFDIYAVAKDSTSTVPPTSINVVITAIGF